MGMPVKMLKDGMIGSVQAMQPVFAGGQIVNANKLAKVGVEAGKLQQEMTHNEVETTATQYYWQVISLQEKLKTLDAVGEMLGQIHKDVSMSVEAGITMRNDLLQVELQKNEVEAQRVKVESGLSTMRKLLAQYIGSESVDFTLTSDITMGALPEFPVALQRDVQSAVPGTVEYRLIEQNAKAKKLEKRMEVGKNLPSVGVGAGWSADNTLDEWKNRGMVFATVQVPLSSWWGGSHAIKRKKLAQRQAEEELLDNSQLLAIRMESLWSDITDAHKQLAIAKRSMEQSDENLRLNRDYYAAGTSSMTDLLTAQQQYQQSRDKYVDAYADYQQRILDYRIATCQ